MSPLGLGMGVGLGGASLWLGYAWGAHLVTPLCVWRGPRDRRRITLTFDDGPDPRWTPKILDTLAVHGVPGTFFLVGERATRAPEVVQAIARAGHEIANHGWSHRNLWFCGPRRTRDEITRAQQALIDLSGREPHFFRPPWGMVNAAMFSVLRAHALRCVFWSIQPEGRRPRSAERQTAYVLRKALPGAIVDLHDADGVPGAPERLAAALPVMIDRLIDAGYRFTTLGTLLAAEP